MDKEAIATTKKYIKSNKSVVTRLIKADNYNDYPPFHQYTTAYETDENTDFELNVTGLSFDEETAKAQAIFETIERWAVFHIPTTTPVYQVDLCNPTKHSRAVTSLGLFSTDSSGSASGINLESALSRSLFELIERDAFAIYYYNRLSPHKIHRRFSQELNELLELLRRYGFQVHLFNLSLDITVPICLCLLEDTTGIKPYFTLGLRAQHNWNESIKGAILESLQSLIAFRDLTEMHGKCSSPILQRIIYWLDKKPKEALGFLFQGEIKTTITPVSSVFQCLHEAGIKKIYFRRIYNENGIVVIQAAVPELVQLPIGGRIDKTHINPRLFSVPVSLGFFKHVRTGKDLNTIPHPFP